MAQTFLDAGYVSPEIANAAARLAANNAQNYRNDARGLGGLLGSLAAKVGDVGKAVYGTIGGGVASFKDLLESGGTNQNNLKAFTNSVYGTNDYKDAVAKQLGTSINAADTLTDFVPGVALAKANPVGGALAGGISGLGNTLKYEGADFDWNDAGNSIASGAITGAVTAGFNRGLNNATKGIGKKIASNAIARGATSGALGGAIGSGVSGALNGQDLGSILGNMASSAASGAVTGAAMSGVSQLGTKAKNAALGKFWGQTPDQVAGTLAQADQLRQQDLADDGRLNNSIPALKTQTETAEETTTGPTKYMAENSVKRPVVESKDTADNDIKQLAQEYNDGKITDSDVQDILMGIEHTTGRDYEDMIYEFNRLTGKNVGDLTDRQDEITARLQKALNSGKTKPESLEQTLGSQTKNMTKAQIIEDLIDTGGAAGYSEGQLKRMTKSQLLELADIQSSETVQPKTGEITEKQINSAVKKALKNGSMATNEYGGWTDESKPAADEITEMVDKIAKKYAKDNGFKYDRQGYTLTARNDTGDGGDIIINPVMTKNGKLQVVVSSSPHEWSDDGKTYTASTAESFDSFEDAYKYANQLRGTTTTEPSETVQPKANPEADKLMKLQKDVKAKSAYMDELDDEGVPFHSPRGLAAQEDWSKADKKYRNQLIKMVKASDKYDDATKKEMIADIKDPFEGYKDRALTRLANQLAKEASTEPSATPGKKTYKVLVSGKRDPVKNWELDDRWEELPIEADSPEAARERANSILMGRAEDVDYKWNVEDIEEDTPQAIATANTLKKYNDTQLADRFAELENAGEITSDDYVLMNQIADETERRGNSARAENMRELAGRAVSKKGTMQENPYMLPKDQRPKNADDWEHMLTNGQVNGRELAAKMDYGFSDKDLKDIAKVYQRNGNARKTIDDMLTDANFHADQEIMEKRAALADAERTYKERTGSEANGGYKEMLEPAKKKPVVEGPAYPEDVMNMKINRGEWGEPTGNEDYTEPTNERYSLNTDDDQGVKPEQDLRNEDIEVPDYTKPVDREGNAIRIEKRNWLQGAGDRLTRAGDRIENQDIYNALYSKTADRAIREGTVDTLKKLGYGPQDYGEAAKVSTAVNQMVDNMVENSRAKINDPDLIDNLRNIANDDSVVLSPAQEKKLNQQIRAITENLGQGDKPFTYDADKLLKESRRLISAGGKAITQSNYVNGQPQNTEKAEYGNQMIEMGRYLRQRAEEATDGLFDSKYTKDQVATMLRNAGANQETINYVTDSNSLSDLIKKTSTFEQARQMDREMRTTPYRRNANAGTSSTNIVNRVVNKSGLGEVADLALTPVGKVTGAGTKAIGNLMTKAGNAYAAVDQYPGLSDQGAVTVANAAARNASNLASQQSNDQYYFDQNPETAQAAAAQFEAQNGLGDMNTQLGTQNALTSGMVSPQGQQYQDPARQQAVDTLNRLANGMQNALNAGDIKAYETIADIYSQYAKIYSAQAEINGWNATEEAEDEKLTANQQKAQAAMQQLNQLASMQPDFGTAVSNVPILGNIVGMTGGNQYATQAAALEATLVNLLSGTSATESEREQIRRAYIPQFTDSDAVKQQKLQSAYQLIQNLYNSRNNWANQVDDYANGFFG